MKWRWLAPAGAVVVFLVLTARAAQRETTAPVGAPADRAVQMFVRVPAPTSYDYVLFQGASPIGAATSTVHVSGETIRLVDSVVARTVVYGDSQTVAGSSTAYMSRPFALDSFVLTLGGDQGPLRLRGVPARGDGVLLPTLVPMALMLGTDARVGRSARYWIFNPLSQRVELTTLSIEAESVFSIVDSATYDAGAGRWVATHRSPVRAWSVATPSGSLSAWVDAQGRLVSASEPGGLSMVRTAARIARQGALNHSLGVPRADAAMLSQ